MQYEPQERFVFVMFFCRTHRTSVKIGFDLVISDQDIMC